MTSQSDSSGTFSFCITCRKAAKFPLLQDSEEIKLTDIEFDFFGTAWIKINLDHASHFFLRRDSKSKTEEIEISLYQDCGRKERVETYKMDSTHHLFWVEEFKGEVAYIRLQKSKFLFGWGKIGFYAVEVPAEKGKSPQIRISRDAAGSKRFATQAINTFKTEEEAKSFEKEGPEFFESLGVEGAKLLDKFYCAEADVFLQLWNQIPAGQLDHVVGNKDKGPRFFNYVDDRPVLNQNNQVLSYVGPGKGKTEGTIKVAIIDSGIKEEKGGILEALLATPKNRCYGKLINKRGVNLITGADLGVDNEIGHGSAIAHMLLRDLSITESAIELQNYKVAILLNKQEFLSSFHGIVAIYLAGMGGANFINLSWGFNEESTIETSLIDKAIDFAISKEAIVVSAAGNFNRNIESFNTKPAASPKSMTIGAYAEEITKAEFSNFDKGLVNLSGIGSAELPGLSGGLEVFTGTSFSAPQAINQMIEMIQSGKADLANVKSKYLASLPKAETLESFVELGRYLKYS